MNAERVVELLREMDRLEQEKDRDGNAEQPWWYMRDSLEDALGLERGGLDNPPPEEDEDLPSRDWSDVTPCDEIGCGHPYNGHTLDHEGYADGPCLVPGCKCGDFA